MTNEEKGGGFRNTLCVPFLNTKCGEGKWEPQGMEGEKQSWVMELHPGDSLCD